MAHSKNPPLSYQDAGVNIDAGNALVEQIKPIAQKTRRPEVLSSLGGFGALFELSQRYQQPVLVSTTDGVGTKVKLANLLQKHDTIGIDLVAMCVNDLIVQGAEPLFFLDYFATSRLDVTTASAVIKGIGDGCSQAGAALIGGETAEMPGIYHHEDYDLAGFAVGVVEKSAIIDGSNVTVGDVIIGVASSGVHSNGFSLVRKILEVSGADLVTPFGNSTLGATLLTPTRIYVKPILALLRSTPVHAIAHITGGGLVENLPRVLPPHTQALLNSQQWPQPAIFAWLQQQGNIAREEMYRTFNCGIGLALCVPPDAVDASIQTLTAAGEQAWPIGVIASGTEKKPRVVIS